MTVNWQTYSHFILISLESAFLASYVETHNEFELCIAFAVVKQERTQLRTRTTNKGKNKIGLYTKQRGVISAKIDRNMIKMSQLI